MIEWVKSAIRDHPRSRGEHDVNKNNTSDVTGSPPLARGALNEARHEVTRSGITPARAGST